MSADIEPADIAGQRVLITGASSGIGAATALAFARRGAVVGLCARRTDLLETVASACRETGTEAHAWTVDLAALDEIETFANDVLTTMGGVDILVNNVGVGRRKKMQDISVADFDETMNINFGVPMRLTTSLLPQMIERDSGHIVMVGGSGTREFAPSTGSYIAAKAALDAYTEALYIDLAATSVRAHLVVPGRTATDFGVAQPGQEPPFPADPERTDSAEVVAEAILSCLDTDDMETYPNERVRLACQERRDDYNGYFKKRRKWFSRRSTT